MSSTGDRTRPSSIRVQDDSPAEEQNRRFIDFLRTLDSHGQFNVGPSTGSIVYADDQFIAQQLMQMNFTEIGLQDRLHIFTDGVPVITYFERILGQLSIDSTGNEDRQRVIQPVPLLFLDICMPYDGIEVTKRVKELYR